MKDTMEAKAILSIPENQPERIFPNSEDEAKSVFRKLIKEWHPDHNKSSEAQQVTSHLQKLYDEVIGRIQKGTWSLPNTLTFKGVDGKVRTVKYRRKRSFELGDFAYGDRVVCYVVKPDCKDLFGRGLETIKHGFKYENKEMEEEISRYLPNPLDSFETQDGHMVLVLSKTPDVFLLQDVLDHFGGTIDPKHVAWIVSCMLNLACYMRYAGITHNALSTTNLFISPQFHSMVILGGWWYSQKVGKKLEALPRMSADIAPMEMLADKIADHKLDLMLVRDIGLELLGDSSGSTLLHDGKTPQPLVNFFRSITDGNAFQEYERWTKKILIDSFGKRRFVEMKIEASDIYKD
jgi:serine/threonine protein kinase